jgi:hypothetical protein
MTMTKQEYRKAIAALGLNQVQAGEFFCVSERTSRNWAAHGAPGVVEMLLTLMLVRGITVKAVNRMMDKYR